MKNPVSVSNIRRPLRLILLLAILLIASNLFISSISQFYIVNREIDNIGRYYKSIGTIVPTNFNFNIKEARELISSDPMIEFEDNKRQTIGMIDELYSVKRHSPNIGDMEGSNLTDIIFIGEINYVYKSRSADNIYQGSILATNARKILAGIPNFIEEEYTYGFDQEHHTGFMSHSLTTGEKNGYINDNVIDELFELEAGKKYIFRVSIERKLMEGSMAKPLYDGGPLYIELDSSGDIDWDDPRFKIIKEEIEFINENIIAYNVIGTKDMTSIPEVQESMKDYYLVEGRWLTAEDNKNQNHAIIIHERISEMYGINIGDNLEMKMHDSEYGEYLASEKDKEEWRTYYTSEPKAFEVVGIFESKVYPGGVYRNMYVPESTIPLELGRYTKGLDEEIPIVYPQLYSFVLKNLGDEQNFIEKYREPLEELEYELKFVINNGKSFLESSTPIKRSSMVSLILFTILLILVQGFAVYVYIDRYKLNYAIERALGVPARVSSSHLTLPLIIPSIIVIFIGGYIGYSNAMVKSMKLLSSLAETTQKTVESGLDIKYLVVFVILAVIPFFMMLLMGVGRLRGASVIDLINNNKKKKKGEIQEAVQGEDYVIVKAMAEIPIEDTEYRESVNDKEQYIVEDGEIRVSQGKKALRAFSLNYILRSKVTSLFLVVIAGIFIFSLLRMNYLTVKNANLIEKVYNQSIITADIETKEKTSSLKDAGAINGRHIDNLFKTGLIQDYTGIAAMHYVELYIDRDGVIEKYEAGEKDKIHFLTWKPTYSVYSSSQHYNTDNKSVELTELNFMEGYSLDDFYMKYTGDYSDRFNPVLIDENGKEGFPILVSNTAMEHFDLKLGDKIFLEPNLKYRKLSIESYGIIAGTFKFFNKVKDFYGYSSIIERDLFIYPISALEAIEWEIYYDSLGFEFKPEKNRELMERKDEIRKIVSSNPFNEYPTELKIWDGELTNVVEPLEKNISLLEVLYPITFILSIVIASILAFMMIIRRSTDVAILRILGVKEKEVQWNLFRENIILVLIGILVSLIIILSITVNSYSIGIMKYAMVIGGYLLGTIVGLILGIGKVTNKKPLELLQVKE